jgi:hypothetical protein
MRQLTNRFPGSVCKKGGEMPGYGVSQRGVGGQIGAEDFGHFEETGCQLGRISSGYLGYPPQAHCQRVSDINWSALLINSGHISHPRGHP